MNAIVDSAVVAPPRWGGPQDWVTTMLDGAPVPLAAQIILPPPRLREQRWVEVLLDPKRRCGAAACNEQLWRAAGQSGREAELDRLVLEGALRWLKRQPQIHRCTINLTGPSLVSGFARRLLTQCNRIGVDPRRVALELSERTPITLSHEPIEELVALAKAGVALAIDDFGVAGGATHLGLLAHVPMAMLKVDATLTRAAAWTPGGRQSQPRRVLDGILQFSAGLGMTTVLEGIEGPREDALVAQLGEVALQGFGLGRPVPLDLA